MATKTLAPLITILSIVIVNTSEHPTQNKSEHLPQQQQPQQQQQHHQPHEHVTSLKVPVSNIFVPLRPPPTSGGTPASLLPFPVSSQILHGHSKLSPAALVQRSLQNRRAQHQHQYQQLVPIRNFDQQQQQQLPGNFSSDPIVFPGSLIFSLPQQTPHHLQHGLSSPQLSHSPHGHQPHRFKNPIQDKLHHAQQSLNDLFSDLLSKPLSNFASNLTFDILTDKVKFPRPLNSLFSLSSPKDHHYPSSPAPPSNAQDQEILIDGTDHMTTESPQKSPNSKKPNPLQNLVGRCYEPYGCFRITEPFRTIYRPINLIPESPGHIKVTFDLRTRANPTVAERLPYNDATRHFNSKFFRPTRKLKLIVHGYLESSEEQWIKQMAAAWLNREDANVISVNWMSGAAPPYTQAVANTRLVGAVIAHLLKLIQEATPGGYSTNNVHIIGHSLGAHIAGYAGELFGGQLGRITGLDPAQPYFQYTDPIVRLDPSDAQFIDVVHTDVSSIMSGGFGMNQTCGHVDFYPNGGISQPGCKEAPIKNVWDSITRDRTVFDGIRRFIGCNHLRSFLLYTEAINSDCPFTAYPCRSYEEFTNGQCTERLMESGYMSTCSGVLPPPSSTSSAASPSHQHHASLSSLYSDPDHSISPNNVSVPYPTHSQHSSHLHPHPQQKLCPIRLGPNSESDYRRSFQSAASTTSSSSSSGSSTLNSKRPLTPSSTVYFLQTADRISFCHFHYDTRILFQIPSFTRSRSPVVSPLSRSPSSPLNVSPSLAPSSSGVPPSSTSSASSSFSARMSTGTGGGLSSSNSGNSAPLPPPPIQSPPTIIPLNGRLFMTIVGSRSQAFGELSIKSQESPAMPEFQKRSSAPPSSDSVASASHDGGASTSTSDPNPSQFRQHHLMLSHPDLGNILRIELEWRPTTVPQRTLNFPLQTRAFKRWLPILDSGTLPSMLTELQKTLNASQLLHYGGLLSPSSPAPEIHSKSDQAPISVDAPIPVPPAPQVPPIREPHPILPLLEGIVLTQMETGRQSVFCASEGAVRSLFRSRSASKSIVLLRSFVQNLQDSSDSEEDAQALLLQRCHTEKH